MSLRPGLVSATFRHLSPDRVTQLAADAGLAAVEWAGDAHVPHGDPAAAERAAQLTADAGLAISGYGSYYCAGHDDGPEPAAVVTGAARLGAPMIRVWAGRLASADADAAYRARVRDDLLRFAEHAAAMGITVALEYHQNTLTDTRESTAELLDAVRDAGVRSLWQPRPERSCVENAEDLRALLPDLANLHVFAWEPDGQRLALATQRHQWSIYLAIADSAPQVRYASLEFVADNAPEQLHDDAETLRGLLSVA